VLTEILPRQCNKFESLHKAQYLSLMAVSRMTTVVNWSGLPLDDDVHSDLSHSLKYRVVPLLSPTEDILSGIEKAVGLPRTQLWKKFERRR